MSNNKKYSLETRFNALKLGCITFGNKRNNENSTVEDLNKLHDYLITEYLDIMPDVFLNGWLNDELDEFHPNALNLDEDDAEEFVENVIEMFSDD